MVFFAPQQRPDPDELTDEQKALIEFVQESEKHLDLWRFCRASLRETLHLGDPKVTFAVVAMEPQDPLE